MRERVHRLANHLASVRRDDRAAQQPAVVVMHAYEPPGLVVDDGAIHVGEIDRDRLDTVSETAGLLPVQSHMGDLRVGVRTPRNDERAGAPPAEEQRVLNGNPRHRIRGMRELELRADVARGVDPVVGSAQSVVDGDSLFRVRDTCRRQIELLDVWSSSGRDENLVALARADASSGLEPEAIRTRAR